MSEIVENKNQKTKPKWAKLVGPFMVYRRWGEQLGFSSRSCPRPPIFFSSRAPPPLGTGLQPARVRGPRPAWGHGGHDGSGAVASAPASPSRRVSPWCGGPRPQWLGGATPCDTWPLGPGGSGTVAHGAWPPARRLGRGCLRRAAPQPRRLRRGCLRRVPPGPGGSGAAAMAPGAGVSTPPPPSASFPWWLGLGPPARTGEARRPHALGHGGRPGGPQPAQACSPAALEPAPASTRAWPHPARGGAGSQAGAWHPAPTPEAARPPASAPTADAVRRPAAPVAVRELAAPTRPHG
jgi:hypothetical protein